MAGLDLPGMPSPQNFAQSALWRAGYQNSTPSPFSSAWRGDVGSELGREAVRGVGPPVAPPASTAPGMFPPVAKPGGPLGGRDATGAQLAPLWQHINAPAPADVTDPLGGRMMAAGGGTSPAAPASPASAPTTSAAPTTTDIAHGTMIPPAAPAGGMNPYAPGGVIPPMPSREAMLAARATGLVGPGPSAAPVAAPAGDPQANQIRFIDQNSPKVAAPNVIRGGVMSADGGSGGMTQHQWSSIMANLPQPRTAAERGTHELMDAAIAKNNASLDVMAAQKRIADAAAHPDGSDPQILEQALRDAQAHRAYFDSPEHQGHILDMRSIVNQTLGLMQGLRQ